MRLRSSTVSILIAAALATVGCAGDSLDGSSYRSDDWVGVTISFAGGRVSGSTGCNNYSAEASASGGSLAIGPAATTRRACEDQERADAEQEFLRTLQQANQYMVSDEGTLTLIGPERTMRFTPEP